MNKSQAFFLILFCFSSLAKNNFEVGSGSKYQMKVAGGAVGAQVSIYITENKLLKAFEKTKSITKLAESLHNQQIKVTIPEDVPLLGLKKGEYDLQRFIYQNIFKLFWKKSMGFYESNMENFDWYYPKYSWRHTEQEIKDWCTEFNLTPKLIKENYSGFTCHALRE